MVRIEEIVLEEKIGRRNSAKSFFILMSPLPMMIKCAKFVGEGKMWRRRCMDRLFRQSMQLVVLQGLHIK